MNAARRSLIWSRGAVVCAAVFVIGSGAAVANAERKVALVVGNAAYSETRALANPPNDARLVASALTAAGFRTVNIAIDLKIDAFRNALKEFRSSAEGAAIAMVYFAGHGIEANGQNWLLPIDAKLKSETDLPDEAIPLQRAVDATLGAQLRIVAVDACRDNPFGRGWRASTRSTSAGLAALDVDDVLVLFASAPGRLAEDGPPGFTGPFATALARWLPMPDVPVQLLAGSVRDEVLMATAGRQRPFVSASITGKPLYLHSKNPPATPVAQAPPRVPPTRPDQPNRWDPAAAAGLTFEIVPSCVDSPDYRQARDGLAQIFARSGMAIVRNSARAQLVFSLCTKTARSESIGKRHVDAQLTLQCTSKSADVQCPRPAPHVAAGKATVSGPIFEPAEELAVAEALDKLIAELKNDLKLR